MGETQMDVVERQASRELSTTCWVRELVGAQSLLIELVRKSCDLARRKAISSLGCSTSIRVIHIRVPRK